MIPETNSLRLGPRTTADGDDEEEDVDPSRLLTELIDVVTPADLQAVAKSHRAHLNPSTDEPPIPSYTRGTGDRFLKMKGAGCRVYPVEHPDEIALANQLVQQCGEDARAIAMAMTKAVHDKIQNAGGHLRVKSPAVVSKWLTQREQQRWGLTLVPFSASLSILAP